MKRFIIILLLTVSPLFSRAQQWAIVSVSVTDMKSSASYTSSTTSQALLGTPVQILGKTSYWYRIMTPEGYVGWTTRMNIVPLAAEAYRSWREADRVIVTTYFETILEAPEKGAGILGNAILGNILVHTGISGNGFSEVLLPDGRRGYLPRESVTDFKAYLTSLNVDADGILETARKFLGFPYLWGGLSSQGMDCSGLVKLCYFLNGIVLERDAKDQIHTGERIRITPDFQYLQKGDLLFFGTPAKGSTPAKVTHVGIYDRDGRFIHSSLVVRRNTLHPGREDSYTGKRLVGACRILGHQDREPKITSLLRHSWYFRQNNE